MNLKQLRYICEIQKCRLNISLAAQALHTNQPGISKQLRLLEDELGFEIFTRQRNRISAVTPAGKQVIAIAQRIVADAGNIRAISQGLKSVTGGTLVVAASHTQATYFLPDIVRRFASRHPGVRITMRHAETSSAMEMLQSGTVDLVVTGDEPPRMGDHVVLPCAEYQKVVIVPRGHALAAGRRPTLRKLATYPHVGYEPAVTAGRHVIEAFEKEALTPEFVVFAISADVIKRCVEEGLGIAVVSQLVFDENRDVKLNAIPAGHLFPKSTTKLVVPRHLYLRQFTYEFIEMCGRHWTRSAVQRAIATSAARH
ncbi:MAG: LysR family transcriptional regulator [Betaproteobacteria bacterium]|nr:LysR family transcriptional regulator [Betaproteobacteria bacterium]